MNQIQIGDTIKFTPSKKGWSIVQGIVQDVLNDDTGYNVYAPLPDDKTRVLRIWREDGEIQIVEKVKPLVITKKERKPILPALPKIKSATELADEFAAKGIDINNSYSEFVRARNLKPELNAQDWLPI